MTNDLRKERLLWALRYVKHHPDLSPDILQKEWEFEIEDCINICSIFLPDTLLSNFTHEEYEKLIFDKILDLKSEVLPQYGTLI